MPLGWDYLMTEPFLCRYVLAAHYVEECKDVIEIGGDKNQIVDFLRGSHRYVIHADPLIVPKDVVYYGPRKRNGRKIAASVQCYAKPFTEVRTLSNLRGYGLVVLGFDMRKQDFAPLCDMVDRSEVAVVEGWAKFPVFLEFIHHLALHCKKEMAIDLRLDLSHNQIPHDSESSYPPRYNRRLLVYR